MPQGNSTRTIRPLIIPIGPSIAYVELTRGLYALIDRDDAETVGEHNWQAFLCKGAKSFYAIRMTSRKLGKRTTVRMHREIMACPDGLDVDHIRGNTLDNRRSELRLATRTQNLRNSRLGVRNTSGLKGAYWNKPRQRWVAQIRTGISKRHLGCFDTAEEAHAAYCAAANKYHGEFARFE